MARKTRLLLLGTGGALLATDLALAQAQLEEIIVTARKRDENLQELPLSVTAISAEQIERQGLAE